MQAARRSDGAGWAQARAALPPARVLDAKYSGQGGEFPVTAPPPPTQRREIDASSIRLSSTPADLPRGPQSRVRGWRAPRSRGPAPPTSQEPPAPPGQPEGQRGSGRGIRQAARAAGRRGSWLDRAAPGLVLAEHTQAAPEPTAAQPAGSHPHTPHGQGPLVVWHSPGCAPKRPHLGHSRHLHIGGAA